jgi:hypothetical protein
MRLTASDGWVGEHTYDLYSPTAPWISRTDRMGAEMLAQYGLVIPKLTSSCWNFPQMTLTLGEWRVLPPQADNSVEVLSMVVSLTRNCGAED